MPWLWTNPTPSNETSAALSSPFKTDAAGIGSVISSLLDYRKHKEDVQNKQYADLMRGVSQGAAGAYNQYQQGQNDDAANAAIYGNLYPGDRGASADSIPDYGGTHAMAALDYARKANPDDYEGSDTKAYKAAQLDAEQALAHNRWQGDSGNSILDQRRQQIIDAANQKQTEGAARNEAMDTLGVAPRDFPAAVSALSAYKEGVTAFPNVGPYQGLTDAQGEQKQALLDAVHKYRAATSGGASIAQLPPAQSSGGNGIRQSDVDQASQAMGAPDYNHSIPSGTSDPQQAQAVLIQQAHDAIQRGADKGAVAERLKQYGIDPQSAGF